MKRYRSEKNDDKLVARIIELYRAGHTMAYIGKAVGKTRSAIAGQINRLGIKNRNPESHGDLIRAGKKQKDLKDGKPVFEPVPFEKQPTTVPEPVSKRLSLVANEGCKWMDDDLLCCGHEKHDDNYCKHHHQRAYIKGVKIDTRWLYMMDKGEFQ